MFTIANVRNCRKRCCKSVKSSIIDYMRCQAMNLVSLWFLSKGMVGLLNYTLADVNPDGSICVSVAAPDTESSVDKRD